MQPKKTLLDFAPDPAAPTDEVSQAEIDRRLERAAGLVEDFAEATALPALEACLAAAAGKDGPGGAPLTPLAETLCQQTAVLQDEIERFLGHIESCRKV